MTSTIQKKLTALSTVAMLGLGLAACTPPNENDATDEAVASAAAQASEQQQDRENSRNVTETNTTTGAATSTASSLSADAAVADIATTTLLTEYGSEVEVPQAIADKYEALGGESSKLGYVNEVKDYGNGTWLATFLRDGYNHYIAYTPETGAQALHGEIAQTWLDMGGFDSTVGAPTNEEKQLLDGTGQRQTFEHGTISWVEDANGVYSAVIN